SWNRPRAANDATKAARMVSMCMTLILGCDEDWWQSCILFPSKLGGERGLGCVRLETVTEVDTRGWRAHFSQNPDPSPAPALIAGGETPEDREEKTMTSTWSRRGVLGSSAALALGLAACGRSGSGSAQDPSEISGQNVRVWLLEGSLPDEAVKHLEDAFVEQNS